MIVIMMFLCMLLRNKTYRRFNKIRSTKKKIVSFYGTWPSRSIFICSLISYVAFIAIIPPPYMHARSSCVLIVPSSYLFLLVTSHQQSRGINIPNTSSIFNWNLKSPHSVCITKTRVNKSKV